MITIAEYLKWKQPKVYRKLMQLIEKVKILALSFRQWKRLMEEPPRPGLGGLLEGEKREGWFTEQYGEESSGAVDG